MKTNRILYKIQNINVVRLLYVLLYIFIAYAVIDVCYKVNTHKHYDMQRLVKDIQKDYPNSKLTFQNIEVVDNDVKQGSGRGRSMYFETAHLYIRSGKLRKEPNFLRVLILLPVFVFIYIFIIDKPNVKVRSLISAASMELKVFIVAASAIAVIFMAMPRESDNYAHSRYKNPDKFKLYIEKKQNTIDVEKYRLP